MTEDEGGRNGFETKKSLGQHFLNNQNIPRLMADAGKVEAGDVVVEVGPGTGVLTHELLKRGAHVIALEADLRAIASLNETLSSHVSAGELTILHSDVRTLELGTLGIEEHAYKVVANIPYYLSGRLFRLFLETDVQPKTLVFLVQKEVAERICRDPKESLLSLSVKAYGEPKYVKTVPRGNFTPQPKVDSAIVSVSSISHSRFKEVNETFFFEVLHKGFGSRRKQLLGNLSQAFDRKELTRIFSRCGISLSTRGEDLGIEEWLILVREIHVHTQS